ncbi:MAG: single-stranded-DNA-specific exonuclease RecJ [Candidatus Omnitrophica bacterium]|nr:single-stranded-DNA-specific exonuclease RecJ [Candidatus Omnitrophota bacterium]
MHKSWNIIKTNPFEQARLCRALHVEPIVAQILLNRGIVDSKEAQHFFKADLKLLHDPFLMKDMDKAVARIDQALDRKERVLIFGDYDADGVTSSALLHNVLTQKGLTVINHIPHRMEHGYGLNNEIIDQAVAQGIKLIITVDCGITAVEEVRNCHARGIDVVIIDHHEPDSDAFPEACAVVDPKRKDCSYPFKLLAAVGLVAKLTQALLGHVPGEALEMVAIGTITDIVPLIGENRIFVKMGLPLLCKTKNKGLRALLKVSKIKDKELSPYHIGFILGPRINAAGRMDTAHKSLDLLLCNDDDQALQLAKDLDKYNVDRQRLQRNIVQEAVAIVEKEINVKDQKVIVVSKEGWHKGVLGIVASKITEKYYRPTIVISVEDGMGTASARSVEGFHLYEALAHCSDCLEKFGGHQRAAGLTIKEDNINSFRSLINRLAHEKLTIEKLSPTIYIDGELTLSIISMDLVSMVETMQPFGEGNPQPLFCSFGLNLRGEPRVMGRETLKFYVTDGRATLSVIGFGMAKYKDLLVTGKKFDIAYFLTVDDWYKEPTVQLRLKDIRLSEEVL